MSGTRRNGACGGSTLFVPRISVVGLSGFVILFGFYCLLVDGFSHLCSLLGSAFSLIKLLTEKKKS